MLNADAMDPQVRKYACYNMYYAWPSGGNELQHKNT
jgi:hypothetical protein